MSHPEEKEVSFFDDRQETNRTNDTFDDGASAIDGDVVLVRRNSGKGAKQYKMSDVSHYQDNNHSRHVPTRTEDMGAHLWESQSSMPLHLVDKSTVYSEAGYTVYSPPQSIAEDHTIDQYDDDDAQTYQTYGTQSDEEEEDQSYVSQTGDGVDTIPLNQDDLYDDNDNNNNEPTNQSGQLSLEQAESVIIHHDVENSVSTTIQHDVSSKKSSKRTKKSSKSSKKKHKRHKSEKSGKDIGHSRKHTRKQSLSNTQNDINSNAATATTAQSGHHNNNTKSIHPSNSAAATLLSQFKKQQHNQHNQQHNQQYQGSSQHLTGNNNNSNGSNNLNVNDSEPDLASNGTVTASSLLTILEPSSRPVKGPQQQMPITPTHDASTGTLDEAALQEVYFSAMIEKQQENTTGRGSLGLPRQISKNYTSDAPPITRKRSSTTKHMNNHNHDRGYDTSAISGILHTSRSNDIYDNDNHHKFPIISNFKSSDQSPNTVGGADNSIMRPQINRDDHYSGSDEGGESDLSDNRNNPNRPRQGRRLSALTRENLMTHTNNQHQHENGMYHSDIEYVRQKTQERTRNGQNFGNYNEDFGGIMSSVEFNDRRFGGNNNDGYATHAGHGGHGNNNHHNHNNNNPYGLPPKGGSFRRPRKHKNNNVTAPMRANIVTPVAVSVASTIPATMATNNTQTPGRNNYPRTINVTGGNNNVTFAQGPASVTGPTPHSAMNVGMGTGMGMGIGGGGGGQIDSFSNYGTVISTNSGASSEERRHQRGLLQRKYDKQSNEDNRSRSPGLASVSEDNEQSPYPYNPIQQQRQIQQQIHGNMPMQNMHMQQMQQQMGNIPQQQQQGMPYMDLSAQNTQRTMYSSHQTQDSSHSYNHRQQEIRYRDENNNNSKIKKYLAIGVAVAAVVVVGWFVLPKLFGSKSKSGYSGRYGSGPRIRRAPRRY